MSSMLIVTIPFALGYAATVSGQAEFGLTSPEVVAFDQEKFKISVSCNNDKSSRDLKQVKVFLDFEWSLIGETPVGLQFKPEPI